VVDAAGEYLAELEEATEPVEEENHESAAVEVPVPPPQTTPPVKLKRSGVLRMLLG
jgi:hypothetical protein